MRRIVEYLPHVALFDDSPSVHDRHPVTHFGDDPEIVGDENDADARRLLKVLEKSQVLRLDGGVERGGGFVRDQHGGVARDTDCTDDSLAHSAGELVWIVPHPQLRRRNTHPPKHVHHAVPQTRAAESLVNLQSLPHLVLDVEDRVQSGHRVLKHHAYTLPPDVFHLALVDLADVFAFQQHLSADDVAGRRGYEAHYRQSRHGFAGPRFSNDAECLAAPELEAHSLDGLHHPPARNEIRAQVLYVEYYVTVSVGGSHTSPILTHSGPFSVCPNIDNEHLKRNMQTVRVPFASECLGYDHDHRPERRGPSPRPTA